MHHQIKAHPLSGRTFHLEDHAGKVLVSNTDDPLNAAAAALRKAGVKDTDSISILTRRVDGVWVHSYAGFVLANA